METTISAPIPFFGSSLDAVRWCLESLSPYMEEDLGPCGVERSCRGRGRLKSGPSILLLGGPEAGLRG
ncbi:hypothetical protein BHM03_00042902 [Ensete ventricosum]|nr:hypothetical protein BHM03_00042902 [Ensete ventricosum]